MADRTGDAKSDLSYLQNVCGATGCKTFAAVLTWDGNSWRDIGPGGEPTGNVDMVKWDGAGAASKLSVRGGKLTEAVEKEAGPSRAATITYEFVSTRYIETSRVPDEPAFLYHALVDAEAVFRVTRRPPSRHSRRSSTSRISPTGVRRELLKGPAASHPGPGPFRIVLANAVLQRDRRSSRRLDR